MRARLYPWVAGSLAVFAVLPAASGSIIDPSGAVQRGDFDNDGNVELVVSSPETNCGKGAVYVVDADGTLSTWTRDTSGVLGTAACNDLFGASIAVGDFDNDGYDDLAIAADGANDTGQSASGSVHVLYGSSTGLTATGDQLWTLNSAGVDGTAAAGDHWGDALTVGDFNCDGYDDLAIGSPRKSNGSVSVLHGSSGGITATNDRVFTGSGGSYGATLAAGNFNGDTASGHACDDLVIASPHETIGSATNAGVLRRFAGGTTGLATLVTQTIHQNSTGIVGLAQTNDYFGWRLVAGSIDGNAYDDLLVTVPGDSCTTSVGNGLHRLYGGSTGITTTGNAIACDIYGCTELDNNTLGCHSGGPPVYGNAVNEVIALGMSSGIVWGGSGADVLRGEDGDDVIFGGDGDDTILGGPGRDLIVAGNGDDTIRIDHDCMAVDGEVVDGGPGTDTVLSHLSQSQLQALGVTFASIESFVVVDENPDGAGACAFAPNDDGRPLRPKVVLSWPSLPSASSVLNTTTGLVTLQLQNTSADLVVVDLEYELLVRGERVEIVDGPLTLTAGMTTTATLDLNDFIPAGVNPSTMDPALFVLPTSAVINTRATLTVGGLPAGSSFPSPIFGHIQANPAAGGHMAVLYRAGALHDTYYHGDLASWRAGASPYAGPNALVGRAEVRGSRALPGF